MLNEEVIKITTNRLTIGQRQAEKVVGGRNRLFNLVKSGEVRVERKSDAQNAKWQCNLYDVLKNAKLSNRA